jgi:signal transduction histidine kinase
VATARAPQDVAVDVVLAGQPYRASARDFAARGEQFRAVIAVPIGPADAALATARQLIFWLLPIITLAAAGVGYLVSARALRPLDAMTVAARSITVDHLDARLAVPAANDELQRLAITFNGMLDRLQSGSATSRASRPRPHELRTPVTIVRMTAEPRCAVNGHRPSIDRRSVRFMPRRAR